MMHPDWTFHLPLAEIEDVAYFIALIVFGLISYLGNYVKKRMEAKGSSGKAEEYEQAELLEEDEPTGAWPPVPASRRRAPESGSMSPSRPTLLPVAKPVTTPPPFVQTSPARRESPQTVPIPASPSPGAASRSKGLFSMDGGERGTPTPDPTRPLFQIPIGGTVLPIGRAARRQAAGTPSAETPLADCRRAHSTSDSVSRSFPSVLGISAQSPSDLRQAVLLAEILAPPVSIREDASGITAPGLWGC